MSRPAHWIAVGLAFLAGPVAADNCRLALLIALDVSSSVDANEDSLQRTGLAAALVAPDVQSAFLSTPQSVALAVYEWSGREKQKLLLDWTLIDSTRTLQDSAAQLALSQRSTTEFPTALGHAVGHASLLFKRAPRCDVHVLDVSGDGENNEGFTPKQAYAAFDFGEVTVNALAIETFGNTAATLGAKPGDMAAYYRRELIRGRAAFVEVAKGFDDYEAAMRRKLSREVSTAVFGQLDLKP